MLGDRENAIKHYRTAAGRTTSIPERNYRMTQAARLEEGRRGPGEKTTDCLIMSREKAPNGQRRLDDYSLESIWEPDTTIATACSIRLLLQHCKRKTRNRNPGGKAAP
jgi:hypothetical protein